MNASQTWLVAFIYEGNSLDPLPWYVAWVHWLFTRGGARHVLIATRLDSETWLTIDTAGSRMVIRHVYQTAIESLGHNSLVSLLMKEDQAEVFWYQSPSTMEYIPRYCVPVNCVSVARQALGIRKFIVSTRGLRKYLLANGGRYVSA